MVLLLATVLASTPIERTTLRTQLDVNGLINASWYVSTGREHLLTALMHSRDFAFRSERLDLDQLKYAIPMLGPWLAVPRTDDALERGLLVASGVLQSVGLSLAVARWLETPDAGVVEVGPVLTLSPVAGGRLGLSLRLTGF